MDPRCLLSLLRGEVSALERMKAAGQLREPWCWPADPALASAAERLVAQNGSVQHQKAAPRPGEVPLLVKEESRGAVYGLSHRRLAFSGRELAVELVSRQRDLRDLGEKLDQSPLPRLSYLSRPPPSFASRLHPGQARVVSGKSLDLALALSALSWSSQVSLPASAAYTARLEGFELRPVDGLTEKLEATVAEALGVTEVWVSRDQLEEATRIGQDLPRPLAIRGARRLEEVVRAVAERGVLRLEPDETVQRLDELYLACMEARVRLNHWDALVAAVQRLADAPELDPEPRRRARVVAAIASRHDGRPLPWPDDEARGPRPHRLLDQAQRLQHDLDRGTGRSQVDEQIGRALALVAAPGERYREDFILLSAIGRAIAASGREADAAPVLEEALEGFAQLGHWGDMSHALCALARVAGIVDDLSRVESAERWDRARSWATTESDDQGRPFVDLALGRAFAQLRNGRDESRARAYLEAAKGAAGPLHVQEGGELWLARLAGERPLRLAQLPVEKQDTTQRVLARLELARSGLRPLDLDEFSRLWPGEAERAFPGLEGRALAEAICERFRY